MRSIAITRSIAGRAWLSLTPLVVVSMGMASAAGLFVERVYARETASWAAQGAGQDLVNLIVVCPALAVTAWLAARGSIRALLIWMGLLVYVAYSYVLYAFFVHFNALFLVYVATLGLSAYALGGAIATLDRDRLAAAFQSMGPQNAVSVYLSISGAGFGLLWLMDVIGALAAGRAPAGVAETGLPINPVHVLDLAFVLPAMIVTSVQLRKSRFAGFLFAVPLLTFAAVMGIAILAMSRLLVARGLAGLGPMELVMGVMVALSVYLTSRFLRLLDRSPRGGDRPAALSTRAR